MSVATATLIRLEADCEHDWCSVHATKLHDQLSVPHYSLGASLMAVPNTVEEWRAEHRTARKRADRAERLGYLFSRADFSLYSEDLYNINTSLERRQGRPMTAGYTVKRQHGRLSADQTRCPRHRTSTYGVFGRGRLRAYTTIHRAGELAMVSMILGHGDHLAANVMYSLFQGVVQEESHQGGVFYYNLHRSGQEGLRFFKERLGFRESDVEWMLGKTRGEIAPAPR